MRLFTITFINTLKFYHATRGHNQGETEAIHLLISSHGVYILIKNEIAESESAEGKPYRKEVFLSHKQIDYIEVLLI